MYTADAVDIIALKMAIHRVTIDNKQSKAHQKQRLNIKNEAGTLNCLHTLCLITIDVGILVCDIVFTSHIILEWFSRLLFSHFYLSSSVFIVFYFKKEKYSHFVEKREPFLYSLNITQYVGFLTLIYFWVTLSRAVEGIQCIRHK